MFIVNPDRLPTPDDVRGVLAGVIPYLACTKLKALLKYDDALDTFGVHAVGGTMGAFLTGVLATADVNANLATNYNTLQLANLPAPGNDMTAYAFTAPGVTINGRPVTINQISAQGDVGSYLKAGANTITVRSVDGYSHTYVLDADTRRPHQPLQSGQQVTVRATETNGASDATAVLPAR